MNNDSVIKNLDYDRKVMAEEVLHNNPGAKILPTQPIPDELPPISEMEPLFHKTCGEVAYYYLHQPRRGEMLTATRARTIDGKTIEPGSPMICGSCAKHIEGPRQLRIRCSD